MALVLLSCLYQTSAKHRNKQTKSKGVGNEQSRLKDARDLEITTRLGFKPLKLSKNATSMLKAKEMEKKRAEYNRMRLSPKHRHKMQRKEKIAPKPHPNEKRSRLVENGPHDFHLAKEDTLIDERASKRVSAVGKNGGILDGGRALMESFVGNFSISSDGLQIVIGLFSKHGIIR